MGRTAGLVVERSGADEVDAVEIVETDDAAEGAVEEEEEEEEEVEDKLELKLGDDPSFKGWMNEIQRLERLSAEEERECSKRILPSIRAQAWLEHSVIISNDSERAAALKERPENWVMRRCERRSLPLALASLMISTLGEHRQFYTEYQRLTAKDLKKSRMTENEKKALALVKQEYRAHVEYWADLFARAIAGKKPVHNSMYWEPILAGALSFLPRLTKIKKSSPTKTDLNLVTDETKEEFFEDEYKKGRATALTSQEEQTLRELVRQGSIADNYLTTHNLKLVVYFSQKYAASARTSGAGLPMEDLVGFGNEGLIKASRKFNWTKGTRFSTYASDWIRQGITRGMTDNSRMIKIPSYIVDLQRKVTRAKPILTQLYHYEPSEEQLADYINRQMSVDAYRQRMKDETAMPDEKTILEGIEKLENKLVPTDVRTLVEYTQAVVSIDKPVGDESDQELTLANTIHSKESGTEDVAETSDLWRIVQEGMARVVQKNADGTPKIDPATGTVLRGMEERKQRIISLRQRSDYTLEMCALKLGLTRERVRQLEAQAMKELKEHVDMEELDEYRQHYSAGTRKPVIKPIVVEKKRRGRPRKNLVPPSAQGPVVI